MNLLSSALAVLARRQAGEDYIEHLPEPPEPVYAEGDEGE